MRCPGTTPTAAHLKVDVLVEYHLAIGIEIGEVDGSLPVHVPVAFRRLAIAGPSVFATHIDAQRVVVEESRVADHAHHRQSLIVTVHVDEGAGGGRRRQIAVGKEAEAIL